MIDVRQTLAYSKYLKKIDWTVAKLDGNFVYCKKMPFLGFIIKIQRPLKRIAKSSFTKLLKRFKPFIVYIEPSSAKDYMAYVEEFGFGKTQNSFVPTKTIHIDLTQNAQDLLSRMHYKTRYNIKVAKRNKLDITYSQDIAQFANFWQTCALKDRKMFLSLRKEIQAIFDAFEKDAELLLIQKDKHLIAEVMVIYTQDTAFYMYAAANGVGKKLFAPTLAVWEAILRAKKKGKKIFDFEGIYDDRYPLPAWKGFSRFKKSFGGKEVEYPGVLRKIYLPFLRIGV